MVTSAPAPASSATPSWAPDESAEYEVHAGDKDEDLATSPRLVDDATREQLTALTESSSPGSGSPLENRYIETAIDADQRPEPTSFASGNGWGVPTESRRKR